MNNQLIIELLNCSKFFIVILDKTMHIKFINDTLAERLGFAEKTELLNRCWLDFIPDVDAENIKAVHYSILYGESNTYNEVSNNLKRKDGVEFMVQWFNTVLNHDSECTFSFGMPKKENDETSVEKVRENFRSRIESDKTMIRSLKQYISTSQHKLDATCDMEI